MLAATGLLLSCAGLVLATGYTSLHFRYSADVAQVPSRAFLTTLNIGVPAARRSLMVDFTRDDIELEECLRRQSYTYDMNDTSDVVLFEEEHITDSRARASFRFSVREHCEGGNQLGEHFDKNCLSDACQGIVGVSRRSPLWKIWSAFTLGITGLRLGSDHPHTLPMGARNSAVVGCEPDTVGVCDFHAVVAGDESGPFRVMFHTENSYTYLPEALYERQRRSGLGLDLLDASDPKFPLVMSLGPETFRHRTQFWNSASATQRSAANLFFSQRVRSDETLLLKAWKNESVISIGNAALSRYTLHIDLVRNVMTLEFRIRQEHLAVSALVVGLFVFFAFMRSVCLSIYEMSWLANGLPILCECKIPKNHAQPSDALRHWLFAVFVLIAAAFAGISAASYVDETLDFVLFYTVFSFNWLVLFIQIVALPRWQLLVHQYGQYTPEHFRRVFVFSFAYETVMIMSLFFFMVTARQDSLGTMATFLMGLFQIFNSWRYFQYWFTAPYFAGAPFLLLLINTAFLDFVFLWRAMFNFTQSWALSIAMSSLALLLSAAVVQRNSNARFVYILTDRQKLS